MTLKLFWKTKCRFHIFPLHAGACNGSATRNIFSPAEFLPGGNPGTFMLNNQILSQKLSTFVGLLLFNPLVIRVRVNRVKMTEKWGQIQGKWDLVLVSGGGRVTGVLLYSVFAHFHLRLVSFSTNFRVWFPLFMMKRVTLQWPKGKI